MMNDRVIINIQSTGQVFVSGIASYYDDNYYIDERIADILTEAEFSLMMNTINSTLESFWPCMPVYYFGYICMCCTIGLSLLCPRICVSEAERALEQVLQNINNSPRYFDRNIVIRLRRGYFSSHLELSYPHNNAKEMSLKHDIVKLSVEI